MDGRRKRQPLEEAIAAFTGSPETPLWVLPGWLVGGLLINWLSNLGMPWTGVLIVGVGVCYGVLYLWKRYRQRKKKMAVELDAETPPEQVLGLILPISTPNLQRPNEEKNDALRAMVGSAEQHIDQPVSPEEEAVLNDTNLKPALAALEYHWGQGPKAQSGCASRLREVWLIATEEADPQGQRIGSAGGAAALLERWFFSRHPEARGPVTFHRDAYQGISLRVSSQNYTQLWNVVDQIYTQAPYKPEQIIADITPGTKVMSVAIALACLPPKRRMQYMVAPRDPQTGEPCPKADLRPMLIDIDPYLEEEE